MYMEILLNKLKLLCNYDKLVKMCGCNRRGVQLGSIIMRGVIDPGIWE